MEIKIEINDCQQCPFCQSERIYLIECKTPIPLR